jgi:molybdopterin-guanine dinucleotide biosynthesis protein A
MSPPFSGVLLAAGLSSRMGRDKALLEVDGSPLWRRQREVLAAAGASEIYLSVRPEQEWARSASGFAACLYDALPGCGPIAGLTAALERSDAPLVGVLAIDMAAMSSAWFSALLAQRETGRGVVGRHGDRFEPLAAVYPRSVMFLAWEAIARKEFSLQRLVAAAVERGLLAVREIAPAERPWFENWNEPRPRPPAATSIALDR